MQILLVALSLLMSPISLHRNLRIVSVHVTNKVFTCKIIFGQHFTHLKTTIINCYTFCLKTSLPHVSINKDKKMPMTPF